MLTTMIISLLLLSTNGYFEVRRIHEETGIAHSYVFLNFSTEKYIST
jgi:hypothetical protein